MFFTLIPRVAITIPKADRTLHQQNGDKEFFFVGTKSQEKGLLRTKRVHNRRHQKTAFKVGTKWGQNEDRCDNIKKMIGGRVWLR